MENPEIILKKGILYLFTGLTFLLAIADVVFNLDILYKNTGVAWHQSLPEILLVGFYTLMATGSINDFFSRAYVFADRIELKSWFRSDTLFFKDVTNLVFKSCYATSTFVDFFIFFDKSGNQIWRLPASYTRSQAAKGALVRFLTKRIPGLTIDKRSQEFLL